VFGVHIPQVSIQYSVPDMPTQISIGESITVTSILPVVEFALSVVVGGVMS